MDLIREGMALITPETVSYTHLWLLGVNSSHAICKAVGFGNNSLGRVQTPVLAEICRRYRGKRRMIIPDGYTGW